MRPIAEAFALGGLNSAPLAPVAIGAGEIRAPLVLLRGERSAGRGLARLRRFLLSAPRGLGLALTLALLAGVATFGAVRGGEYQAFIAREGDLRDVIARALGFDIAIVTISGQIELREREILAAAHITPKDSLLFLDAAAARKELEALPLVKSASVRKLYPNHLVIDLVERAPYALWQKDGKVAIVAADGAPIDQMTDDRFIGLPFVVGDGANERLPEFMAILNAASELRPKIKAGVLVSGRRWDLAMTNGMVVKLPETDPEAAMATLVRLQRADRVLERAALSLDFRVPGRMFVRLTEEAASARAAAARPAKKGAT
ncbi:MAG TPA: cell division protein FtsQ/DivIB [Roseiarcus sp.]|nr:cell division protein FtsQ/DivIB [Roseiarcus sp.]